MDAQWLRFIRGLLGLDVVTAFRRIPFLSLFACAI